VKFRVVLEHDPIAESWSAVCPELPGCASAGDTEAEARGNIEDAIRLYLAPSDLDLPQDAKLIGWEFRQPSKMAKSCEW